MKVSITKKSNDKNTNSIIQLNKFLKKCQVFEKKKKLMKIFIELKMILLNNNTAKKK